MLQLSEALVLDDEAIEATDLTDRFTDADLKTLGGWVLDGYKADNDSRRQWLTRLESAMNLALQLQEEKTFPWAGAANVKFPLVTIACMQWHARAYPTLLQGPNVVQCRVFGADPEGKKTERARRVSEYMSYQLLEDDPSWEEESDRMMLMLPLLGCVFKKSFKNPSKGRNVSEVVNPKDLVMNYWATSVEDCERKTHIIPLTRNQIHTNILGEIFRDVSEESWLNSAPTPSTSPEMAKRDRRLGMTPPQPDRTTPYEGLEQHVRLDLDQDGYAEPYIITVEKNSGCVLRIVFNARKEGIVRTSEGEIIRIRSDEYFTKFSFIPSPDGGIYDVGFGVLLGPLNEAVDSLINQLIDAGTLATTAGGFLGRGIKIRGGEYSFRPFGWQRLDSTGEDISKSIFPMPTREPSSVLLQLLSLLIDYTNRMSGSTDIMVGENPGQNTPAQTSQLMAEQGAKINSAIYKRVWRSFKNEFEKLYLLFKDSAPIEPMNYGTGQGLIAKEDFGGPSDAVRPAADPHLASDGARLQQAIMIKQAAMTGGGYDHEAVERNFLQAAKVQNMDVLYKGLKAIPAPPPPKVMQEEVKHKGAMERDQEKHKVALQLKMADLMAMRAKNLAEIDLLKAQALQTLVDAGAAQGAQKLQEFEMQIKAGEALDKGLQGYLKLMQEGMQNGPQGSAGGGSLPGMGSPPGNAGPPGGMPPGGPESQGQLG